MFVIADSKKGVPFRRQDKKKNLNRIKDDEKKPSFSAQMREKEKKGDKEPKELSFYDMVTIPDHSTLIIFPKFRDNIISS